MAINIPRPKECRCGRQLRIRKPTFMNSDVATVELGDSGITSWNTIYVCPNRWPFKRGHDKVVHRRYPNGDELNEYAR